MVLGSKSSSNSFTERMAEQNRQRFLDPEFRQQFSALLPKISGMLGERVSQPLNLQLNDPFSRGQADPIVQNMISQGIENIKAKEASGQRGLAQALSVAGTGDNTAQIAALNRAGQIASAGAQNALIPKALEQQREFDAQRAAIETQQNQLRLAQRQQAVQELMPFISILDQLGRMGVAAGGEKVKTQETSKTTGSSKTSPTLFGLG